MKKILNLGAAALTVALAMTPVMAEGSTYTAINGTSTTFKSTLNMKSTDNVPNLSMSYSIAFNSDKSTATAVTGTPTIAAVDFSADDALKDASITKNATVDFSGVTFAEPGVYRFNVTQNAADLTNQGISQADEDTTKALDVYVIDDNGALKIGGYVMHNDETADVETYTEETTLADKDEEFSYAYNTSDLTITKTVAGNQASRDEYFPFEVKISNAVEGTKYSVDLSNCDATTKTTGNNAESHTNASELTVGADGTVTATFWLQHGQSVKINGLAGTEATKANGLTAYSISETTGAYTASIKATGDTDGKITDAKIEDTGLSADTTVAYTNTKSGVIPTGVFMTVGGSAAATLLAGAGVVLYMNRKKKDDEDAE